MYYYTGFVSTICFALGALWQMPVSEIAHNITYYIKPFQLNTFNEDANSNLYDHERSLTVCVFSQKDLNDLLQIAKAIII